MGANAYEGLTHAQLSFLINNRTDDGCWASNDELHRLVYECSPEGTDQESENEGNVPSSPPSKQKRKTWQEKPKQDMLAGDKKARSEAHGEKQQRPVTPPRNPPRGSKL